MCSLVFEPKTLALRAMSVRAGLRQLIDSLEARYQLLSDDSQTLEQDTNSLMIR